MKISMDVTYGETALQEAIEKGDIVRVKQLVESGVSLNAVLTSVSRRESATVLAMAAYEGQTEIMKYLIEVGANVNIKDPYFGRNALHWACLGGSMPAVQLLLHQNVDVNCVDRDNVSPILRASMNGCVQIIKLLIKYGADVNQQDRLRSSALHYSSFHGMSDITSELIKAGCIQNNPTIFGQGTPLANLVYHSDLSNCHLLLEAGYTLENEAWLQDYDYQSYAHSSQELSACVKLILQTYLTVPPLVKLCHAVIRRVMAGAYLQTRLTRLPLPESLISFLCLQ